MRCVMRHAWTPKFQLSGPTVHSYTVVKMAFLSRGNTCRTPVYDSIPIGLHLTTEAAATQYTRA